MSEILTPQNGEDSNDDRPRLVLDTNTVLALWMFRDSALDALREWIEAGKCRLYSREDALEELRRVLAYRQFALDQAAQNSVQCGYSTRLTPWSPSAECLLRLSAVPQCSDPADQKFLDIALLSHAQLLVTRDKALLRLQRTTKRQRMFSIDSPDALVATLKTI